MTPPHLLNQLQTLALGLGRDGAATTDKVLQGEPQRHVLLEDPCIMASQLGLVTDILLAGQSLMCSDKGCDILMFHPEAFAEGVRSIGVRFPRSQKVTVKATLVANGTIVANVGTQPLPPHLEKEPPDVSQQEGDLCYAFGLGSVTIATTALGELTAKATKECTLGALFLDASASALDLMIEYVKVNNKPLLSGRQDSTIDSAPVACYSYLATDLDGRTLAFKLQVNDTVTIGIRNNNAGSLTVYGGIFCLPEDDGEPEGGE